MIWPEKHRALPRAVALSLGWLTALAAHAAPALVVKPDDAVAGHPGVTYLDLMRQAVPDLAVNDAGNRIEGHLKAAPRNLVGDEYQGPAPDPVVLGFMQERRVRIGGRPRIAVMADLGPAPERVQSTTLLLLYDDAPRPRLLDFADVSMDKDTEFADQAPLPLGPGDDALVTYSEHDDADFTMGGYVIVSLVGDRLRLIDKVGVTSEKACGWSGVETANFATAPDPGRRYRRIEVAMEAVFKHTPEDCGSSPIPKALSRTYRATYRWNLGRRRFEAQSTDWKALDALNRAAF